MDVAPLKHRLQVGTTNQAGRRFHVRMDVAPLKPVYRGVQGAARFEEFPRSNGRGPIEAKIDLAGVDRSAWRFHVRMDVAPLKPPGDACGGVAPMAVSTFEWTWPH